MTKLASGLAGAIGSRYLSAKNRIIFVEYGGFISRLNLTQASATIVSQGTTVLKGTWMFDCETGTLTAEPRDVWWEQMTAVKRQMAPRNGAKIVNLGIVDFNAITPAALQTFTYSTTPIPGNNNATNKLVNGDVFCVHTAAGNYCKIQVVTYGYDMTIKWVTYKPNPAYLRIGSGYTEPEDVAVLADESTAYVTERGGNLLRVNLSSANRAAATVVCSGMTAPHQIWVDEVNNNAYVVEYANPGKLWRINLATGTKTALYSGLNFATGLTLSSNLAFAYVSEQGSSGISRIELATGAKVQIATGLTAPFFLTWADTSETRLLVPERDPANKVSMVDVTRTTGNVTTFIAGASFRPSSITVVAPGTYCVCSNTDIDRYLLAGVTATGLYKGIGYVPHNLITAGGMADTTTQPAYPFQFPKNSPFGGTLPVQVDHRRAWESGIAFYKVLIDGVPRTDSWNDLVLNPANGRYEIIELQKPDAAGFYSVHSPAKVYYNTDLGCLLDSTMGVSNALHTLKVEFYNAAKVLVGAAGTSHALMVNNQKCVAAMDMPTINSTPADPQCGYLKYTNVAHDVNLHWVASHPAGFATYSFWVRKGAFDVAGSSVNGALAPPATSFVFDFTKPASFFLGTCPSVAAFYEWLYVAATMINGVGRQSQYDASVGVAFCLAP